MINQSRLREFTSFSIIRGLHVFLREDSTRKSFVPANFRKFSCITRFSPTLRLAPCHPRHHGQGILKQQWNHVSRQGETNGSPSLKHHRSQRFSLPTSLRD